jgi:glycerol-3-phosphate dehydrogenase
MFTLEVKTQIKDSDNFDILIIGGGITGIAIAREAAERGHSVAVIEKNDFGCATSAATSKLIHGGLRYLENFEFSLVRESLRERRILMLAASHLVKPLPFIIPILPWTEPNPFLIYLGLKLYDILSFDRNQFIPEENYIPSTRRITHHELINVLPELKNITKKGGFLYYDCQSTHPERLTLAFLKSAAEKGAKFFNHIQIENFITEKKYDKIILKGVEVKDKITGKSATLTAKVIVNATGPWIDILLSKITGKPVKKILRSKGIHLLTKQILNHKVAVLFRTKTHRHFFVIPWMGYSLIGPTDTPYNDEPDNLKPTEQDIEQLINDVNETIPNNPLSYDKIIDIPIGIRPLIFTGKGNTYKASRKYEIFHHISEGIENLISVAGGKWTTSRQLGEDVIKEIYKEYPELQKEGKKIDTSQLPLYGSPGYSNPYSIYENFALKEFRIEEISIDQHKYLISLYGTEHIEILKLIKESPSLAEPISSSMQDKDLMAQVLFAIQFEGARTLDDIVRRRIGYGTYGIPKKNDLEKIAHFASKYLKWTPQKIKQEVENTLNNYPIKLLKH